MARFGALAALICLASCSYGEIRPTAAVQEADGNATIERFGAATFEQIAPDIWQHTTYLDLPGFGAVPSNGLLVIDGDTAVLVDTAWTDDQTRDIVDWAGTRLGKSIRAAVVTHAHQDKMGGMAALHDADIATFAHHRSNAIAPEKDLRPARSDLRFGEDGWPTGPVPAMLGPVRVFYPGAGHTADNITIAVEGSDIAFGGCLIKHADADGLGNLADADAGNYANAVARFAAAFPHARTIAMSHSRPGDRRAITRTASLARQLTKD